MSKEKQTPCEAAWKKRASDPCCQPYNPGTYAAFMVGFRAGEEGKVELLDALKELQEAASDLFIDYSCPKNVVIRATAANEKARAAIAKHTAK